MNLSKSRPLEKNSSGKSATPTLNTSYSQDVSYRELKDHMNGVNRSRAWWDLVHRRRSSRKRRWERTSSNDGYRQRIPSSFYVVDRQTKWETYHKLYPQSPVNRPREDQIRCFDDALRLMGTEIFYLPRGDPQFVQLSDTHSEPAFVLFVQILPSPDIVQSGNGFLSVVAPAVRFIKGNRSMDNRTSTSTLLSTDKSGYEDITLGGSWGCLWTRL